MSKFELRNASFARILHTSSVPGVTKKLKNNGDKGGVTWGRSSFCWLPPSSQFAGVSRLILGPQTEIDATEPVDVATHPESEPNTGSDMSSETPVPSENQDPLAPTFKNSIGMEFVFVAKLKEQEQGTGWLYRVPTEEEFEYTCRGGPMSLEDKANNTFDFYFKYGKSIRYWPYGKLSRCRTAQLDSASCETIPLERIRENCFVDLKIL